MPKALKTFLATASVIFATWFSAPAFSSVGLEEWHLQTPGKNYIGHFDPFTDHETVIISRENEQPKLHVVRIERWQYLKGYVAGEADHLFFLFNEKNKETKQYQSEQQLNEALQQLKLGRAKDKWLTPRYGWEKNWGKVKNTKLKKDKST